MRRLLVLILLLVPFCIPGTADPIRLEVDATDAPLRVFHTTMTLPAGSGKLTLHYPKWFPGTHAPTGHISDMVSLRITAGDRQLSWKRDTVDMFTFHCETGDAAEVKVSFDFVVPTDRQKSHHPSASSAYSAMISWTSLLLYPAGMPADAIQFAPVLRLPDKWSYGTALKTRSRNANTVEFEPVSLYTLIDSPVVAGRNFRTIDLAGKQSVPYQMHLAADSTGALEVKPAVIQGFQKLLPELQDIFRANHLSQYHFLVTLSDPIEGGAVEHHESSDNRPPERMFLDEDTYLYWADTLPHEIIHSWNGKYRRPAGEDTKDYQETIDSELVWIYEGLTNYLGYVLATRSGLMTEKQFQEGMAWIAGTQDRRPGREWKPLRDTTVAVQVLNDSSSEWGSQRRRLDYYNEGTLIWLEVDMILRRESKGRASLDDFCRAFFGGHKNGPPEVKAYTLDDVVNTLNTIAPFDWKQLFASRVDQISPRAPVRGLEEAGWRLAYATTPTQYHKAVQTSDKEIDLRFSAGLILSEEGAIRDVLSGSPAALAGAVPGMKILGINGRRWSKTRMQETIRDTKQSSEPVELLLEDGDFYKVARVDYHDGEKYPILERIPEKPDTLHLIITPRTNK